MGLTEGDAIGDAIPNVFFDNAIYVVEGAPVAGFNGNTSGGNASKGSDDANTGNSITSNGPNVVVTATFATAVSGLRFDVIDIEVGSSVTEIFTAKVFDAQVAGNLLATIIVDCTGNPVDTGDGAVDLIDFFGITGIMRLEFDSQTSTDEILPGYAIDNLSSVPLPTSLVMLMSAAVVLGSIGRKQNKQSS
ncbi:MAG: hypothetical protein AAF493_23205 [Pseudomonadota bacterium]